MITVSSRLYIATIIYLPQSTPENQVNIDFTEKWHTVVVLCIGLRVKPSLSRAFDGQWSCVYKYGC